MNDATVEGSGLTRCDGCCGRRVDGGSGTIEVKGNGPWHINKAAPWKATVGSATFAKDKWTLSDGSAKVSGVPAGDAVVKVYVCNGDQCKNAEVHVAVK